MNEKYSFFDAVKNSDGTYDRTYSSADLANYFSSFIGNGVYAQWGSSLQVVTWGGLQLAILPGKAFINGYYYQLDFDENYNPGIVTLDMGDNTYTRIDLVVLRLDLANRKMGIQVIKGSASANPQAPAYSRTSEKYDLVLAEVTVAPAQLSIDTFNIKDCRTDEKKCGFVAGVVEQVASEALFYQFDDAFNAWFAAIKGKLSEDAAGKLSNRLDATESDIASIKNYDETNTAKVEAINKQATATAEELNALNKTFTAQISTLQDRITMGTSAAPSTGKANTIYIQLL